MSCFHGAHIGEATTNALCTHEALQAVQVPQINPDGIFRGHHRLVVQVSGLSASCPCRPCHAMPCRTPLDPFVCSCRTNAKGYNLNRMWNQSSEVRLPSSQGRQHFRHNAVAGCLQRDRDLMASCSHQMKLYNVRLRYCHSWGRCVRRRRLRRYSSLKMQCTDTASTCSWIFTVSSFLAHVAASHFRLFCCQMNTCEQDPLCSWLASAGMKHHGSGGTVSSGPSSFDG